MSIANPDILAALDIAHMGSYDGAHHKQWVIDQMVRQLCGCPFVEMTAIDYRGCAYTFQGLGENENYRSWVAAHDSEWDTGIAP